MPHQLIATLAWVSTAAVIYATFFRAKIVYKLYGKLSPIISRPTRKPFQHLAHVIAFAVVGLLLSCAYPRHAMLVVGAVVGGAAILEFLQVFTPDRHAKLIDALWKMAGGVLGVIIGNAFASFIS